jgi:hypothetical protein
MDGSEARNSLTLSQWMARKQEIVTLISRRDFEYPSSDESDDKSLNGSESGNDDSYKELASIEQEGQGNTAV